MALPCGVVVSRDADDVVAPRGADSACVLVAGGLGERLGYSGIKIALPIEFTTNTTYMGLYCKEILALQEASNRVNGTSAIVPLAIMTSDDTHARTVELLEANHNFGMADGQVPCPLLPSPVAACCMWACLWACLRVWLWACLRVWLYLCACGVGGCDCGWVSRWWV